MNYISDNKEINQGIKNDNNNKVYIDIPKKENNIVKPGLEGENKKYYKDKNEMQNADNNNLKEKQNNKDDKVEFSKKIGNYVLFEQIGRGTFSKVTKAIHLITSQQVAVKILNKQKIEDEVDLERIIREIEILKNINHPNIAQMYETYSTIHNFYLMMELVKGGDLFDYISDNSSLSENQSCHFFRQLIGVLEYLFSMGITHRDIKPENILLDENHLNIKVIDFGLSNYWEDNELIKSSCGSPCYASPEMLSGKPYYGDKTDIWSSGVVLYSMLVGSLPFDDQELYSLYEQIKKGKFYLPSTLSLESIDLLKRLLQVDPDKRIGIKEIKRHTWFNMEKNPIYRGINISKEKFPYNMDAIKFIYENYFKKEKEIDIDKIVKMIETHACNKYTATYYLSKIYILKIDNELLLTNIGNTEENNINNNKIINYKTKNSSYKERNFHKCKSNDNLDNNYNNYRNNILGKLTDNDIYNNIEQIINIDKNKTIEKNEMILNNYNRIKNVENEEIIKNEKNKKLSKGKEELKKLKIVEKKIKNTSNNKNDKKAKILNKRNNNKILYISVTHDTLNNKLDTLDDLRISNNFKKQYKQTLNKENINSNCLKDKKLIKKSKNNSNNKSLLKGKKNNITIKNNKNIIKKVKEISNISKNNNNSQLYDKNQIVFFKKNNTSNKIKEHKKNLPQLKTPPKENNNFNFYVINNIINKDKYFKHKKFETLKYDNKALTKENMEPNEIKSFVNKRYNIIKNKDKENEFNMYNKYLTKTKNSEKKNNGRNLNIKPNQMFETFQFNSQLKINKKIKLKEDLNKFNKIKVNIKTNNSYLYYDKSPSNTLEINNYKKDLKKIIPKLKLEGINNKIKAKVKNSKKITKENNIFYNYNKIANNNYSYYAYSNMNSKDYINENISSINNRSNIVSNNKSKIYQRENNHLKNCIISKNNKNYLNIINFLNKDIKILTHQRNLSSAIKTKLSNIKAEINLMRKSNKKSIIAKRNNNSDKKNKNIKNNNSININNSYMQDYFAHNLNKRKNSMRLEDNNLNSYKYKSINSTNSFDKNIKKNLPKRTSYFVANRKYIINNHNQIIKINNTKYINSKINRPIKKEYYINNNNQNVININMVLKQNKHKNRNINNYLISSESMNDTPNNINFVPSPYFTENISLDNNYKEKAKFNLSTLFKRNAKRKNM